MSSGLVPDGTGAPHELGHLVSCGVHEVHRVADDPGRPLTPAAHAVEPVPVVEVHAGRGYGEHVEIAVGVRRSGGERAEHDEADRGRPDRRGLRPQPLQHRFPEVGQGEQGTRCFVVTYQGDQRCRPCLPTPYQAQRYETVEHRDRAVDADTGQPGDGAHRQLDLRPGEDAQDLALGAGDDGLDRLDVVHTQFIAHVC